ncbi:hypothetical protein Golomagni_06001 [Golovinomyces magnicellulatus]|nr:hypothetical protein Golomagni_06001 [Golovinomyces magnicellulatus]
MASRNPSKCPMQDEAERYPRLCPGGGLLIAWQLKGKKVLIVGGGPVAAALDGARRCQRKTVTRMAADMYCLVALLRPTGQRAGCRCHSGRHVPFVGTLRRDALPHLHRKGRIQLR